jgi:Flp pilus assembly protein TadD/glycosyltransferase involved in cell wall biosynthesis
MPTSNFEKYISEADDLARQNDWEGAYKTLALAQELNPNHPGVVTGLGTCMLQLGRPANSLAHFQRAASLAPHSPEAFNNVGVAYAMLGSLPEAEKAYQKAVSLDPNHIPAWKNLALVYLKQERMVEGVNILAAVVKTHPGDVEALFLLAQLYEEGKEYASARTLYQSILNLQPGNPSVLQAMERLAEPTFRGERIARPEHAKKLAALKGLKKGTGKQTSEPAQAANPDAGSGGSAALYGPADLAMEARLGAAYGALAASGVRVKIGVKFNPEESSQFKTFLFANPHTSAGLAEAVVSAASTGKRVIVDLDRDFQRIPAGDPGYDLYGPGNAASLKDLETALAQASLVTVPNEALAEKYKPFTQRVEVVPNGWTSSNLLWNKPSPHRNTINIGFLNTHISKRDTELLKQDIAHLLRIDPRVLLVIGGDPELFEAFSRIAKSRCMFLPTGRAEDYPYMLANFDILLAPLRNTAYNQSHSDLPLLEAGIRGIPWVASPLPAFREWEAGGLFAARSSDWLPAIKKLANNATLRQELGSAGRAKAEERESSRLAARWLQVLSL